MAPDSEATGPAPAFEVKPHGERWFGPYRGLPFATSLKWLAVGAVLYALLLFVAILARPGDAIVPILGPSLYLTPVFGLPLVLATVHRPGRTRRLIYFLLFLPLAHIAANYLAWSHGVANHDLLDRSGDVARDLTSGALGGVTGAALSFTALHLFGLTARRSPERAVMLLAILALTAFAAGGMALGLLWTDATRDDSAGNLIIWYQAVHLPWQLAFAAALAWLMRTRRARPVPPPTPAA